MARIESLSILTTDTGKEYLAELYARSLRTCRKRWFLLA